MHSVHALGAYLPQCSAVDSRVARRDTSRYRVLHFFINLLPWFTLMPKINGNEIRPGNVLEHNGGLWAAVKVDHVKPGKGGAFAQVEMRNLRNGS